MVGIIEASAALARFPPSPSLADSNLPAKFMRKVKVDDKTGCWLWIAGHDPNGYGRFWFAEERRLVTPYRYAFTVLRGKPGPGLSFDHLCRRPACANPWHVEPVSHVENIRRGLAVGKNRTECRTRGHTFILFNGGCHYCHIERRGVKSFGGSMKLFCKGGHYFSPENTYWEPCSTARRQCRICRRVKQRERRQARRQTMFTSRLPTTVNSSE